MSSNERWLEAVWPFVRDQIPSRPASVLEIGCGPLGGFVPMLRRDGHEAVGVDPEAPAGSDYRQVVLADYDPPEQVDLVVACASLHHVGDLGDGLRRAAAALRPGGSMVVVEWAWERIDEPTARWCFDRLDEAVEHSWVGHRRAEWRASGLPWDTYFLAWATAEGLHRSDEILRRLDDYFDCQSVTTGPFFFADLADTTESDEQAAIDDGAIRASGIHYAGRLRPPAAAVR